MSERVKCPYCTRVFDRHDGDVRTIEAESFMYDHVTDRHQDMIPEPVPVTTNGGVTADD